MKQAALPNGKTLQFDDDTSDKEIQRAVRRELGLADKNILEGLDSLADRFETMSERMDARIDKPAEKQRDSLLPALTKLDRTMKEVMSNAIMHNAQVLNGLHDLGKIVEKTDKDALKTIERAMRPLVETSESLANVLNSFRGDIKEAISYSHDITEANLKATTKAIAGFNNTVEEIKDLTQRLEHVLLELRDSKNVTRRAYRNSDGSWTLEARSSSARHGTVQ